MSSQTLTCPNKIVILFAILMSLFATPGGSTGDILETKQGEEDIELITRAIGKLNRPALLEISTLIQQVDPEQRFTSYHWGSDSLSAYGDDEKIVLKRNGSEYGEKIVVFSSDNPDQFGPAMKQTYVVLRKYDQIPAPPTYLINLAYIWESGYLQPPHLEWDSYDEIDYLKTELTPTDKTLGQNESCDFPEWIFGTCLLVSSSVSTEDLDMAKASLSETDRSNSNPHPRKVKRNAGGPLMKNSTINATNNTNTSHVPLTPSSFDMLQLDQLTFPNGTTELEFKSEIPDIDPSPSIVSQRQATFDQMKCNDCSSIGNFYDDYTENAKTASSTGQILKKWYSQNKEKVGNPNEILLKKNKIPFVGFGDCGNEDLFSLSKSGQNPISKQLDDVIEFYLETLRLHCQQELSDELRSWLTSKLNFIHVQPDLALGINPSSKIVKYSMLSKEEAETLFSAVILSQYTISYIEESSLGLFSGTKAKSSKVSEELSMEISNQTAFLKRLVLKTINFIEHQLLHHYIKMTRSLVKLLQDKFYTLIIERLKLKDGMKVGYKNLRKDIDKNRQKYIAEQNPSQPILTQDLKLNYNDLLIVMGLKEFIMNGMEPTIKSGISPTDSFTSFYQLNAHRIQFLVDAYKFE